MVVFTEDPKRPALRTPPVIGAFGRFAENKGFRIVRIPCTLNLNSPRHTFHIAILGRRCAPTNTTIPSTPEIDDEYIFQKKYH